MPTKKLKDIETLLKEYHISFDGPIESQRWPDRHKVLFENIRRAGSRLYDDYKQRRANVTPDKPWVNSTINRADRLVKTVQRCNSERLNEAGWRLALEPQIFSRFTVEVAW